MSELPRYENLFAPYKPPGVEFLATRGYESAKSMCRIRINTAFERHVDEAQSARTMMAPLSEIIMSVPECPPMLHCEEIG